MSTLERKSWPSPDGSQTPDKTHGATINFGAVSLTKVNLQPGWKWSECIKPHVETHSCQAGHIGMVLQGTLHVVSDDGSEITVSAVTPIVLPRGMMPGLLGVNQSLA